MKKYLSAIATALVIAVYLINYNNVFDYERISEDTYQKPYLEDLSILEEGYIETKEYDARPSINELLVKSGSLGDTKIEFDKPNEFEELSEEDNQKIFFFGRLDTDSPAQPVLADGPQVSDWDEWGWEGQSDGVQPPSFIEEQQNNTEDMSVPIEVTLDVFISN